MLCAPRRTLGRFYVRAEGAILGGIMKATAIPQDARGCRMAIAAETHSDRRFASVFVTAPDVCAGMGLASLPRFQLCAYLVSPGLQPTFIPWQRRWRPTLPSRGLCWRSIIVATANPNTIAIPKTT